MSPLARSLLALACAALLHAACADLDSPKCSTVEAGILDGIEIRLPIVHISTSLGPVIDYQIPDNCTPQALRLQGETVAVCDGNAAPVVTISYDLKVVHVSRIDYDPGEPDATLQVVQYCI